MHAISPYPQRGAEPVSELAGRNWFLRALALLAIGVTAALAATDGARHGWQWALALLPWALALPMWPWTRRFPSGLRAAIIGALALIPLGMELDFASFGAGIPLFIILMSLSARLGKGLSLVLQTALIALACLPALFMGAYSIGTLLTALGLLALLAFIQSYLRLREAYEDKAKLLDALIEAQRRLESRQEVAGEPSEFPEEARSATNSPSFTRRDREVLALLASGYSNKEIAARLFLAEGTVKNRVSLILEKIGARDRTQAALRARDLGIL